MYKNNLIIMLTALLLSACGGMSSTGERLDGDVASTVADEQPSRMVNRLISNDGVQSGTTRVLSIKHHLSECEGFQVGHCYVVREGDGPWELLYEPIEGFDYQWGIDYQVLVETNPAQRSNELADLTHRYQLLSVLQSNGHHGGAGFDYVSRGGGHDGIERLGEQRYTLSIQR